MATLVQASLRSKRINAREYTTDRTEAAVRLQPLYGCELCPGRSFTVIRKPAASTKPHQRRSLQEHVENTHEDISEYASLLVRLPPRRMENSVIRRRRWVCGLCDDGRVFLRLWRKNDRQEREYDCVQAHVEHVHGEAWHDEWLVVAIELQPLYVKSYSNQVSKQAALKGTNDVETGVDWDTRLLDARRPLTRGSDTNATPDPGEAFAASDGTKITDRPVTEVAWWTLDAFKQVTQDRHCVQENDNTY